jgi:hypothetical protein
MGGMCVCVAVSLCGQAYNWTGLYLEGCPLTGMVCHRYSILATVPVPVKPVTYLLLVDLHQCFTLYQTFKH